MHVATTLKEMDRAMNNEERQLISGLFGRMQQYGSPEKDRDAEQLIAQSIRANPDAHYMLVQSVLVQENALQQADQRIQDLEARVQELEAGQRSAPAAAQSGGFLGGLFGGSRPAAQPSRGLASVPATGRPAMATPPANSPWGRPGQAGMTQAPMQQQAAGGGGGFMKTAMATAAGVAGGMLLANSIQGMMNPGSHGAQAASASTDATTGEPQSAANAEPQYQDPTDNDPGNYDTAYDNSGGDVGGGDFDA